MPRMDELRLMTKVARMYYELSLGQGQIAAQLDLSQATVSRLLKRAEREQIVRISVSVPHGAYPDLEEALQATYGLKEAIIADSPEDDDDQVLRDVGAAAAFYVENTVKDGDVVGISSWSATLLAMVDAMHALRRPSGAQVVQILGGLGNPVAEVHATQLTRRLASLLRGAPTFLAAPGVVGSAEARQVLLDDSFVQLVTAMFEHIDLALVGIGALEPSRLLASSGNIFSPEELAELHRLGAVGDICLRFFDAHGSPVATPLDKRVLGMTLDQLQRVRRSVGVAGGLRKLPAIRAALRGGWIKVLVTDRFTAERLVRDGDLPRRSRAPAEVVSGDGSSLVPRVDRHAARVEDPGSRGRSRLHGRRARDGESTP